MDAGLFAFGKIDIDTGKHRGRFRFRATALKHVVSNEIRLRGAVYEEQDVGKAIVLS